MAEEKQYEEIEAPKQRGIIEPGSVEEVHDDGTMSLIAHLTELRSRLIKCLVAVALGSVLLYRQDHALSHPAGRKALLYAAVGGFFYLFEGCVYDGLPDRPSCGVLACLALFPACTYP